MFLTTTLTSRLQMSTISRFSRTSVYSCIPLKSASLYSTHLPSRPSIAVPFSPSFCNLLVATRSTSSYHHRPPPPPPPPHSFYRSKPSRSFSRRPLKSIVKKIQRYVPSKSKPSIKRFVKKSKRRFKQLGMGAKRKVVKIPGRVKALTRPFYSQRSSSLLKRRSNASTLRPSANRTQSVMKTKMEKKKKKGKQITLLKKKRRCSLPKKQKPKTPYLQTKRAAANEMLNRAARRAESIGLKKGLITQSFETPKARLEWYQKLKQDEAEKLHAKTWGAKTELALKKLEETAARPKKALTASMRQFIKRISPITNVSGLSKSELSKKYQELKQQIVESTRKKRAAIIYKRLEQLGKLSDDVRRYSKDQFADWWEKNKEDIDFAKGRRAAELDFKRNKLSFSPKLASKRLILLWYRQRKRHQTPRHLSTEEEIDQQKQSQQHH